MELKVDKLESTMKEQLDQAYYVMNSMLQEETSDIKINIKHLNERIMTEIEPMLESTRIDLHNLCIQKTFYFSESNLLTSNEQVCYLTREIPNFQFATKVDLVYRASRDGWYFRDFHRQADKKGPTNTLYKTKGGVLCGGYTKKSWLSPPAGDYQYDSLAFVFNLDT